MKTSGIITALTASALLISSQLSFALSAADLRSVRSEEYIISVSGADKRSLAERLEKAGIDVLCVYRNFDLIAVKANGSDAKKLTAFSGVGSVQKSLKYLPAQEEEDEAITDESAPAPEEESVITESEENESSEEAANDAEEEPGKYSAGIWTIRQTIESEYDGAGTVVAVIDSAFDTEHYEFVLSDDSTAKFDLDYVGYLFDELNASNGSDTVMDLYRSPKIPFAFDYGDMDPDVYDAEENHGTHVSGIIAGNNSSQNENGFWGIAPEAQLVMMKVLESGGDGFLSDTSIFAALDDALTLGVDAVNLSLGSVSGFAEEADYEPAYSEVIRKLRSAEINVYYSAGNESSMGPNSLFSYYYGIDDNPTYAPDRSTVGSNGTYSDVMSVASAIPDYRSTDKHIRLRDGTIFDYENDSNETFEKTFLNKTLEYVAVPGLGTEEDYADIDVSGKIALIRRGELTFIDKLNNAAAAGAIGALVYGNTDASDYIIMSVEEGQIPAAYILMEDGAYLAENIQSFSVIHEYITSEEPYARFMSDFSSWGPNGLLDIKPDITGFGSDIYSALPDGEAGNMSGTSMSAPYLTGVSLLMRQMLSDKDIDFSAVDGVGNTADRINNLLMSSAEVIYDDIGVEYSPRLQGAGLAVADTALACESEILDPVTRKAKIALGDKLAEKFKLTFELINLSDHDKEYYIGVSALIEDYYNDSDTGLNFCMGYEYPLEKAKITSGASKETYNIYNDKYIGPSVTVKAGSSETITLDIHLSAAEMNEFRRIYRNGYFIEGFIYAYTDEEIVSAPYLGFVGDWAALPMFDRTNRYLDSLLYSDLYGSPYELGWSLLDEELFDDRLIAISPNNDGYNDNLWIDFKLLRNAVVCDITIFDENGRTVYSGSYDHIPKTYQDDEGQLVYDQIEIYFGTDQDNEDYIYPDGEYTVQISVSPEYDRERFQDISMTFTVDTVKPEMTGYSVSHEDGKDYLTVTFKDDRFVQGAEIYESYLGDDEEYEPYYDYCVFYPDEISGETEAVFDITGVAADHLYIDIYDEAMNCFTGRIDLD